MNFAKIQSMQDSIDLIYISLHFGNSLQYNLCTTFENLIQQHFICHREILSVKWSDLICSGGTFFCACFMSVFCLFVCTYFILLHYTIIILYYIIHHYFNICLTYQVTESLCIYCIGANLFFVLYMCITYTL